MDCLDLQKLFGKRYRVTLEANGVTKSQTPEAEYPWLYEIVGRKGMVYPHGSNVLAAVGFTPSSSRKLRGLTHALTVRGDQEVVITFEPKNIESVFKIIKPRKRRRLTDEQRAAAIERLKEHQFHAR